MTFSDFRIASSIAFAVCIFLFIVGKKFAPILGITDQPDIAKGGRKDHEGSIPLIGGLIIIPVFSALTLWSGAQEFLPIYQLLLSCFILLIMGAIDDRFGIMPWVRFILQIWVAAFVVVECGAELTHLGNLFGFGEIKTGWFGTIFSITCLVLLMNALNMLDGVDGLVGSVLIAMLGWLAFAMYESGHLFFVWPMLFLIVTIVAFLVFNGRYPFHHIASIFLGDAGSLSLALLLGYFAILSAQKVEAGDISGHILQPVSIIWIMTLPIVDTFAVFFVRVKQGRSPFDADRLHAHYKLIDGGWTPGKTTAILFLFTVVTGAIGYYAPKFSVPDYALLYSWSVIWLGYTYYRLKHA